MSSIERCFTTSYTFSNMSKMDISDFGFQQRFGGLENHYGIKWQINIRHLDEHMSVHLCCNRKLEKVWAIRIQLTSLEGEPFYQEVDHKCIGYGLSCGIPKFIEWSELGKKYIKNNQLEVKCHVTIKSVTGIKKEPLRIFDKSMERFSDVILKVGGQDFYVSKLTLAMHSPYFEGLFLGGFEEANKSTVELKGVDPEDFQDYLELIHCPKSLVSDFTLERMLELCDMYETPMVLEKCKDQLMNEKSQLSKKDKLRLSAVFGLKDVMDFLIGQSKTFEDLRDVLPDDDTLIESKILRQAIDRIMNKQSSSHTRFN